MTTAPRTISPRIVYSPYYNIGFFGIERLHPFDSRKYGRAWKVLRKSFAGRLKECHVRTDRPISREELLGFHTKNYLAQLRSPVYLARALEVPLIARSPWRLTDWCVLRPMRWATRGTILAAEQAMQHGLAVNLGGGFHHASANRGEGFCIYNDIALAIGHLRRNGMLGETDRVVYVDTDAHQGNGVCHAFSADPRVFLYDIFNRSIYPAFDVTARRRIDCSVPLESGTNGAQYLRKLQDTLPRFLDSVMQGAGLAIYNAGTDPYAGDSLGSLQLSAEEILDRDRFVLHELTARGIPTLMLLSGGYSRESYQLIAQTLSHILNQWGPQIAL
jgi:histone deacetylase 11